jgi:hypothetical protein
MIEWTNWEEFDKIGDLTFRVVEITRKLHNFLASAKTLTDHTRALQQGLESKGKVIPGYKNRIKRCFDDSSLQHFIKDLRNYMVHRRCPDVDIIKNLDKESSQKQLVRFQKKDLLEWDGWDIQSRSFIQSIEKEMSIHAIVTEYAEIVHEFNRWLLKQIMELSDSEITEIEHYTKILQTLNNNQIEE